MIAVLNLVGSFEAISKSAHRLNQIDVELLAQTPDEHFDRVRIAIEILIVKMLDEFRARNDAAAMMGEIGEQPVFQRRQLDRIAVDVTREERVSMRSEPISISDVASPAVRRSSARTRARSSSV